MPTVQQVHLDKMLSNISIGYSNEMYIADQIFKDVTVQKQSDKYYVFGKERFRANDDLRAPGTEANEISWRFSSDQYFCQGHALRHGIADEEVQNADDALNLETEGTELVTEGILLNKEIDASNQVLDPKNYHSELQLTLGTAGTYKWSDYDHSDPVLDIQRAKEAIHKKSGVRANTLIISEPVLNILKLHPKLKEIIKYVQRGIVTEEIMAVAFGVDNILVGSALKSSANNPGQGDILNYIWGNSAVLAYIPANPGRKQVALGYNFAWNKDGQGAVQVRKWYEIGRRATLIEAENWYSQKIVSNVAGFLFQDAIVPLS